MIELYKIKLNEVVTQPWRKFFLGNLKFEGFFEFRIQRATDNLNTTKSEMRNFLNRKSTFRLGTFTYSTVEPWYKMVKSNFCLLESEIGTYSDHS